MAQSGPGGMGWRRWPDKSGRYRATPGSAWSARNPSAPARTSPRQARDQPVVAFRDRPFHLIAQANVQRDPGTKLKIVLYVETEVFVLDSVTLGRRHGHAAAGNAHQQRRHLLSDGRRRRVVQRTL